ncbi:MAG: prolipoprotein diacylglyceryl transferase [Dethiobacter sp.]|jgi:phosphatidylglycerol:prolipoprotein diacylglycerol transferase|nr:MAG: prolipoprotein diacylglyceryl transferase [Dethiobacter sp.]
MRPILFVIGNFELYSYGAMLFIAFAVAIIWALKEAGSEGIDPDHLYEVFIMIIILALLGSRLTFVFLNWNLLFRGEPWWKIFAFREGGLTFYGGFIAALLGGLFYSRYRKISFLKLLDFMTPFIALGYAITRIGCFLNGCCYGHITTVPWGVIYPAIDAFPRHPTQLYASASALAMFFLLRYLRKFSFFPGFIFIWFLIFYGIYRFIVEFFRVSGAVFWVLSPAQLAALLFIIAGIAVLLWQKMKIKDTRG